MQVTPHWTNADLAAALDPSGGGGAGEAARAHAAECTVCAACLAQAVDAERSVERSLRTLDHPFPAIDMAQIVARSRESSAKGVGRGVSKDVGKDVGKSALIDAGERATRSVTIPNGGGTAGLRHSARWWTGVALLGIATAAAAAVPRSPVRHFVTRIFASLSHKPVPSPLTRLADVPQTPPLSPRSVAIVPHGPIRILFRSTQPAGVIRVIPGSGSLVTVRSSGDGASYTVGQDVIAVGRTNTAALSYDVELPPVAQCPNVRIIVGEQLVYSRSGNLIHAHAVPDPSGRYTISFQEIVP